MAQVILSSVGAALGGPVGAVAGATLFWVRERGEQASAAGQDLT